VTTKYSMTQSIARSLCDRVSCWNTA